MRPVVVVVVTVIFCQYLHLLQIGKHLPVQELVSHAAYERLRVSVLPRSTGLDVESFDSRTRQPTLYGFGHELSTILRADEARCSSLGEQSAQSLYHILGSDRALRLQRQALPAVLLNYGHHLQSPTILRGVHREVVAPDVARVLGLFSRYAVLGGSHPPPFALFSWNFRSASLHGLWTRFLFSAQPSPEKGPHSSVAIARVLSGKCNHPPHQGCVYLGLRRAVALTGAG